MQDFRLANWMCLDKSFTHPQLNIWQRLRYKRWIYLLFSTDDFQLGTAWVDLGYAHKVFAHLSPVNPALETLSAEVLKPGPSAPRTRSSNWQILTGGRNLWWQLDYQLNRGQLNLSAADFEFSASWPTDPQLILWADHPFPHHTHKAFAIPAKTRLRLKNGQTWLREAFLGSDISNGYPPQHTRWHWAFANSPELGFNLVEGFTGQIECAIWHQRRFISASEACFVYPKEGSQARQSWHIQTHDQRLTAEFQPVSAFEDHTQLGLIRSEFIQAYGYYQGSLQLENQLLHFKELPGVAEFQDTRW